MDNTTKESLKSAFIWGLIFLIIVLISLISFYVIVITTDRIQTNTNSRINDLLFNLLIAGVMGIDISLILGATIYYGKKALLSDKPKSIFWKMPLAGFLSYIVVLIISSLLFFSHLPWGWLVSLIFLYTLPIPSAIVSFFLALILYYQ